ncbi:helix-turn-helix transcriptional regulator [Cellulomonas fimi]|uniref:Helix-turn-helix type 11 domain protein n=1 Tax=Cellulomonas fimi (strain ATCC 484 / DSM 20113 / JCM 1341 / CCUG 24087 / LMG 16345 / NBRC 15513 / NCIMB 8980 / NCTC 7547 / NRS-133) TaxID=590998 RepID=F4H0L8_CELFA|nr:WYL domain-containing protein [Cellulomonas fimi]AEE44991.1 helix-turn-helix type 11 domain protein [Cellulomonas fimi ATCC 484]NNH08972.1 WYL domain-containing protein [Cellulomonas fimi]VEH27906.1 biotin operon repressor [Cellulomonas fimi]
MASTSARLLTLLGLLQSRPDWSGGELADRLGVTDRTVRNDVARLRELGYPVDAVRGPGGRYRLGAGARLPPLLLDDAEAVAVAVGLRRTAATAGFEEPARTALAKLEQVLPDRLRRRLAAIRDASDSGPENTDSNVEDPPVDAGTLAALADAIRDHHGLRAHYCDEPVEIEPYRLVAWQRRWFLVARDPATGRWAPYRVDWLHLRAPGGRRFVPVAFPGDPTEFTVREVARTGWAVHARITVDAPADEVLARINPTVGTVEPLPDGRCVLVTGGDSVEVVAVWIGMLGLDFHVEEPAGLVEHLRVLAARYARAVPGPD